MKSGVTVVSCLLKMFGYHIGLDIYYASNQPKDHVFLATVINEMDFFFVFQ